jgi:hypothetical protein
MRSFTRKLVRGITVAAASLVATTISAADAEPVTLGSDSLTAGIPGKGAEARASDGPCGGCVADQGPR